MTEPAAKLVAPPAIRTTFPEVRRVLWKNRRLLLALGVVSVLLGLIPTLKSQFESGVVNTISDIIREKPASFTAALEKEVAGYDNPNADIVERLSGFLVQRSKLSNVVFVYLALIAAAFLVNVWGTAIRARLGQEVLAALRARAMKNALMLDTTEVIDVVNAPGQYANAIQQGSENVANTYEYWFRIGEELLAIGIALIAIGSKSPEFSVLFFGIALVLLGVSHWQHKRLEARRRELDKRRNALLAQTDDVLSKREILAAYEQQDRYTAKVTEKTLEYAEVGRKLDVAEGKFQQFSEALMDVGQLMVLMTAVAVIIYFGVKDISDAYFIILLYGRLLRPTSNLIARYTNLRRAEATAATFLQVYAHKSGPEQPFAGQRRAQTGEPGIRFENVTFDYPGREGKPVLEKVSFNVPGNSTTLLLGPSGCGKSTIAKVILGFWPVDKGQVLVNGLDIREYPSRQAIRDLMSYVAQGDHIVDDSIRDNLSWAARAKPADDQEMLAALKAVGLRRFRLDHEAKELSIGEQQRLSVARLMLDESPILILDEPLSGVDVFTMTELMPHLASALKGKTALLVTHKMSFTALADHVVVLDENGDVVEQNHPRTLRESGGKFAQVYEAAMRELEIA